MSDEGRGKKKGVQKIASEVTPLYLLLSKGKKILMSFAPNIGSFSIFDAIFIFDVCVRANDDCSLAANTAVDTYYRESLHLS